MAGCSVVGGMADLAAPDHGRLRAPRDPLRRRHRRHRYTIGFVYHEGMTLAERYDLELTLAERAWEIIHDAKVTVIGPCPVCGRELNPRDPDAKAIWSAERSAFVCVECGNAEKR